MLIFISRSYVIYSSSNRFGFSTYVFKVFTRYFIIGAGEGFFFHHKYTYKIKSPSLNTHVMNIKDKLSLCGLSTNRIESYLVFKAITRSKVFVHVSKGGIEKNVNEPRVVTDIFSVFFLRDDFSAEFEISKKSIKELSLKDRNAIVEKVISRKNSTHKLLEWITNECRLVLNEEPDWNSSYKSEIFESSHVLDYWRTS